MATCEQFLRYVAWLQRVPNRDREAAVRSALDAVGLTEQRGKTVRALSGGMARRLGIAQALVHRPGLLLLDEPTAGLDPRQRVALRETIAAVGRNRIVLVSTHLVEDVRGLADRVIVLDGGQVVFDGDTGELARRATPASPGDTELERGLSAVLAGRR
jgi:ABC-2 type transport system ATP-binding protein